MRADELPPKLTGTDLLPLLRDDPELYADLALKIQTKSGELVDFAYNTTQRILHEKIEAIRRKYGMVRVVLLKARQFGGSTLVAGRIFNRVSMNHNQHAKVIAHSVDTAYGLLNMYQIMYDNLPVYLQPMKKYQSKSELTFANGSRDPIERRSKPGLNSSLGVYTAKTEGAGRSKTLRYLHCSEVAFWGGDTGQTMLGLLNTVPSTGEAAQGTEIFVESTANGVGDYFYNLYHRAKRHETGEQFHAIFLPWYLHEEYSVQAPKGFADQLTRDERDLLEEHPAWEYLNPANNKRALTLDQLYWRRLTLASKCDNDETRFKQEYPTTDEEAFVATGTNFFDVDDVQSRLNVAASVPPVFRGELEWARETVEETGKKKWVVKLMDNALGGQLRIYEHPEKGEGYVIFADVSEGLKNSDFSEIHVLRKKNGAQVAVWRGRIEPDRLAQKFYDLGKYYNWAFGAPEVNQHGLSVLYELRTLGYTALYKRITYEKNSWEEREQEGWMTTSRTRPLMLDTLRRMFRDRDILVNDPNTLEQMKTFTKEGNKYQAQEGCYDDAVMGLAGACQMLAENPAAKGPKLKSYLDLPAEPGVRSKGPKKLRKYNRFTGALE